MCGALRHNGNLLRVAIADTTVARVPQATNSVHAARSGALQSDRIRIDPRRSDVVETRSQQGDRRVLYATLSSLQHRREHHCKKEQPEQVFLSQHGDWIAGVPSRVRVACSGVASF